MVTLEGHKHGAAAEFRTANFSVLSSNFEGFGLVLVESMAAGCIPIAYDIRYGPSDIITDGVDGFLIPSGDVHGLAAAIHRVSVMEEKQLRRMREAAMLRARDFGDEAVLEQWGQEFCAANTRRLRGAAKKSKVEIREAFFTEEETARISGHITNVTFSKHEFFVAWEARSNPLLFSRVRVSNVHETGGTAYFSADVPVARLYKGAGDVLDLHFDITGGGELARHRMKMDMSHPQSRRGGLKIYTTKHGNLSISAESLPDGI